MWVVHLIGFVVGLLKRGCADLLPEEYTLRSWDEIPNTGDNGYLKEFPVLGHGKEPGIRPHCEPGVGIMDVPGKKWVLGDTLLRRYYSIYDDDRGLVGFSGLQDIGLNLGMIFW